MAIPGVRNYRNVGRSLCHTQGSLPHATRCRGAKNAVAFLLMGIAT
jgi:hypothetical protein